MDESNTTYSARPPTCTTCSRNEDGSWTIGYEVYRYFGGHNYQYSRDGTLSLAADFTWYELFTALKVTVDPDNQWILNFLLYEPPYKSNFFESSGSLVSSNPSIDDVLLNLATRIRIILDCDYA
jgi:hypothetical protein